MRSPRSPIPMDPRPTTRPTIGMVAANGYQRACAAVRGPIGRPERAHSGTQAMVEDGTEQKSDAGFTTRCEPSSREICGNQKPKGGTLTDHDPPTRLRSQPGEARPGNHSNSERPAILRRASNRAQCARRAKCCDLARPKKCHGETMRPAVQRISSVFWKSRFACSSSWSPSMKTTLADGHRTGERTHPTPYSKTEPSRETVT